MTTQSSSQFTTLNFLADNETLTIVAGVTVGVTSGYAVGSTYSGDTLSNHGHLFSGTSIAVDFSSGGTVFNRLDGEIRGYEDGIHLVGEGCSVTNAGVIVSIHQTGVYTNSTTAASLANTGKILGYDYGALVGAGGATSVHNTGLISAAATGLLVSAGTGKTNAVTNGASGVIKGDAVGIYVTFGALKLINYGKVTGGILNTASERDTINNHRQISGATHLGSGADRFDGHDGIQGKVFGEVGSDTLIGGAKHDVLSGGYDRDTLTGKQGADYFDYDAVNESLVGNTRDFITDFKHSEHDRIDLRDVFGGALTFRGTSGFTGAGQVRYVLHNKAGTAHDTTSVFVNTDANLGADMQIEVRGLVHFQASDFFL